MDKPITFQKIESDVSSVMERKWFVQYLYVGKCNLGKVNLEAMLVSSFPSHAEGGPMLLPGASCDLHTQLLAYSSLQSVVGIALLLAFHFCAVFLFYSSSNNVCSPDQQLSICQFFRRKFATRCDSERRAFYAHFALHRGELFAPILVHCFRAGCWQSGVPDPALLAVVDAVKAALAAEKGAGPSSNNVSSASLGNSATVALPSTSGGVPAHSPSLSQQTATFLTSGGAFPEQQPTPLPSATHCRSNFFVPSFVATFAILRSPILSTMITPSASVPVPSSDRSLAANLLSGPLLQQPFVNGQPNCRWQVCGFGGFVICQHLSDWPWVRSIPWRTLWDFAQRKKLYVVASRTSWLDPEAFTIFTLILTSLFSAPMEIFNVLQTPHFTHVPSVQ